MKGGGEQVHRGESLPLCREWLESTFQRKRGTRFRDGYSSQPLCHPRTYSKRTLDPADLSSVDVRFLLLLEEGREELLRARVEASRALNIADSI